MFCIYFIKIKAFPLIIFALSSQYSCFQKINLLEFSTDCKSQLLNIERKQKGRILLYETNNTDIAHFFTAFGLDAPFRTRICCRIKPSLKFSTTKLTQGQTTSVRVEFSSKDNLKVKAGDTITFTLPPELQGMTENDGSPRKISLGELGEAMIYKDRVIATFNEKVNQLEHVKGYFNFGLQATRTKNPNDTSIKTNLSTTATAQEITIHGDPGNTGEIGTLPFFWKSGDMLGEKGKVRWFVNANMTKEELSSDIILTDTHINRYARTWAKT